MAPVKPPKRSQSAQSHYISKMNIKRESVKPKRESIVRTPSIVPGDVQEAHCGVHREPDIPDNCRRGVSTEGRARRAFVSHMTTELARKNKVVVGARWM